jgi:hypothetical protein
MEDKRGTKRPSSSVSGSSSPSSDASTPPLSPSGYLPPSASPSDVSSRRPPSSVFKQGGPSEKIPVVDVSSSDEDDFPDTSRDEEFIRRLFGDLNHGLSGLTSDDNVIVIRDSDEEEEMHEEHTADAEAALSSVVNSLAPTTSAADADDAPDEVQGDSSDGGDEAGLSCQKRCQHEADAIEFKTGNGIALLHYKFFYKKRVVMAIYNHCCLNLFCASCRLFVSVMSL